MRAWYLVLISISIVGLGFVQEYYPYTLDLDFGSDTPEGIVLYTGEQLIDMMYENREEIDSIDKEWEYKYRENGENVRMRVTVEFKRNEPKFAWKLGKATIDNTTIEWTGGTLKAPYEGPIVDGWYSLTPGKFVYPVLTEEMLNVPALIDGE